MPSRDTLVCAPIFVSVAQINIVALSLRDVHGCETAGLHFKCCSRQWRFQHHRTSFFVFRSNPAPISRPCPRAVSAPNSCFLLSYSCALFPALQLCLLLLEKSVYTDEAYLFALLGLLLSCTDCGKTMGLDAPVPEEADGGSGSRGGGGGRAAALRHQPPDTVPHWHTVLLRFQVRVAGKASVCCRGMRLTRPLLRLNQPPRSIVYVVLPATRPPAHRGLERRLATPG